MAEATTAEVDDAGVDWGKSCAICHDPYTSEGPHRVVVIQCGHLFGMSCIQQVFATAGPNAQSVPCPNCRVPTSLQQVRVIFAKTVRVKGAAEKEKELRAALTEKLENAIDKLPDILKGMVHTIVPLLPLGEAPSPINNPALSFLLCMFIACLSFLIVLMAHSVGLLVGYGGAFFVLAILYDFMAKFSG